MTEAILEKTKELINLQNQYDKEFVKDIVGAGKIKISGNNKPSKRLIEEIVSNELKRIRTKQTLATKIAQKSDEISQLYLMNYVQNDPAYYIPNRIPVKTALQKCNPTSSCRKRTRKHYGIVFVDSKFTEFTTFDDKKLTELTNLRAYATIFSEPKASLAWNRWKERAFKFNSIITPNWLNRLKMNGDLKETPEFMENIQKMKHLMGVNDIANEAGYLDMPSDYFENGVMTCDERKTFKRFGSYLKRLSSQLGCKKLVLASFSSSFTDVENPSTIPIINIVSKMVRYGHYDKLEKYVVGYTDLLSVKARKDFTRTFNGENGKNQCFYKIKPFANKIIRELETAFKFSWPNEKPGSQALGGLMTLLAYHESKKVDKIISFSLEEIREISNEVEEIEWKDMCDALLHSSSAILKTVNFPCLKTSIDIRIFKENDNAIIDLANHNYRHNSHISRNITKSMTFRKAMLSKNLKRINLQRPKYKSK